MTHDLTPGQGSLAVRLHNRRWKRERIARHLDVDVERLEAFFETKVAAGYPGPIDRTKTDKVRGALRHYRQPVERKIPSLPRLSFLEGEASPKPSEKDLAQ